MNLEDSLYATVTRWRLPNQTSLQIRQVLLIMKFTAIILLTACLAASANGHSQNITLKVNDAPLEQVFKQLELQSGYSFIYTQTEIAAAKKVNLDVKRMKLAEVLQLCFKNQPLSFTIRDRFIVVKPDLHKNISPQSIKDLPPPIDVKGRVVNEKGEPVVGASIVVKGNSTKGTTTDVNGNFILRGVTGNETLVISGANIETLEIRISNRSDIGELIAKISVAEGEVFTVKTNYWVVKKRENTGNISKVSREIIEKQPVSNPVAALQGMVAGLEVIQQTGVPGGNFSVRIRGTNSISNGNDPLYIIDGVPFISESMAILETTGSLFGTGTSPLNGINISDIENVEVLKDADATAIYGSRGANGVILITTQKGKAGKTKIDFNLFAGTSKVNRKMNLLNTPQYLEMRREAFANDAVTMSTSNARDLLVWDTTRFTDWQDELIGNSAHTLNTQLSISGGDVNTQFMVNGGYQRETTVFPGSNSDQKISFHTNIKNRALNQKLVSTFSIGYVSNISDMLSRDLTSLALSLPPVAPALYDSIGNLSWNNWSATYENPVANTKRNYEGRTNTLTGNAVVSYLILPNLSIRSSIGYTNIGMTAITIMPIRSQAPSTTNQHQTNFSNSRFQNWIIEPQINWSPSFRENRFEFLLGQTFLDQVSERLAQTGSGFASEGLMKNLAAAPVRTIGTNYFSKYRYMAVYSRINYSFKKKYIVNITYRRDGSSRFGPGKQFANFGASGIAWLFSEEKFIKKSFPILSYGKLRMSYGTSGNDQIGDYQYLDSYSPSVGSYLGSIGLTPDRLSNPEFAWETNKKFELGLELGFLNDRILTSFSFYQNRSSSQLVGYPLPTITGFNNIQGNFPATVQNTGIESEINSRNIETKTFSWTSSINISIPRNKLLAFPNIAAFPAYVNKYVVGEPLAIRKLYHYTGIDPLTGVYTFEDVNRDGSYNDADRQTIGFVGRDFSCGLYNSLKFRGLQIDFLFHFVKQDVSNYVVLFGASGTMVNVPATTINRWQNAGDNTAFQRYGTTGAALTAYSRLVSSQNSVSDASFVKLRNLSISYTLPSSRIKKLHIEDAKIFIRGQNILTITKYKGLDPEMQGTQLPQLRVLVAGVHFTL